MTNGAGASSSDTSLNFFQKNWDKVITIVLAIVVGGVTGFSTAILAVHGDIQGLSDKVVALETEARTSFRPAVDLAERTSREVGDMNRTLEELQRLRQAESLLRENLQLLRDQVRQRTVSELSALLRE